VLVGKSAVERFTNHDDGDEARAWQVDAKADCLERVLRREEEDDDDFDS
jgi:hypothetical protein